MTEIGVDQVDHGGGDTRLARESVAESSDASLGLLAGLADVLLLHDQTLKRHRGVGMEMGLTYIETVLGAVVGALGDWLDSAILQVDRAADGELTNGVRQTDGGS